MSSTEPAAQLENQLADFLGELSSVQTELLEVLGAKRECMADGKIDGLPELQAREEQLGERLKACHDRRNKMLESASESGLPNESLGDLAKVFPSENGSRLREQVNDAAQRTRLLQHESLTNWVLAQRSLLHVSQLLEIIVTGGRTKPTYGITNTTQTRGALLDQEA